MSRVFSVHMAVLCLCCIGAVHADPPTSAFVLGSIEAQAGTTVSGYLEVPRGIDQATRIPVSTVPVPVLLWR